MCHDDAQVGCEQRKDQTVAANGEMAVEHSESTTCVLRSCQPLPSPIPYGGPVVAASWASSTKENRYPECQIREKLFSCRANFFFLVLFLFKVNTGDSWCKRDL